MESSMAQKSLVFKQVDITKGAVRYGEVVNGIVVTQPNAPGATIGTLYVRKSGFGDIDFPKELNVTLSWDE
jgi:hypothetical protein